MEKKAFLEILTMEFEKAERLWKTLPALTSRVREAETDSELEELYKEFLELL